MTSAYRKRAKGGWSKDKDVSNRKERSYEDSEIREQLEENTGKVRKVVKKSYSDKEVTSLLSSLRYIYKFALNHAHGDVENLKFPECSGEWFNKIRQEYYQDYKKKLPRLIKLLERDDLPKKIQRQIKEVLALFNIETP
jgi:hypothetical protein